MKHRNFQLQPFLEDCAVPEVTITGTIGRVRGRLSVTYEVRGRLEELELAPPVEVPHRQDGLWRDTCFELFLAPATDRCYWEFNLSPTGQWNVYHFSDYRQQMQEEAAFRALPYRFSRQPEMLTLDLECPVARVIPPDMPIEIALSAVIVDQKRNTTYWALAHPVLRPDFHRRDGFLIVL